MRHLNLVLVFFLFQSIHVLSQGFNYDSVNESIQVYNPLGLYGGGVSFYDFNKDGYDDLTFCTNGDSILTYRNVSGDQFVRVEILPNVLDAKQPTWIDYDNDGDADLMVSKRNTGIKLYRNDGNSVFTDVTTSLDVPGVINAASYGCAWADYDRDGFLDCYVTNYNWGDGVVNWLFHNNGDGTFTETATELGVDNGSLPSYQATWVDFDFDLWPDLYVVNDKFTGNSMYRNTGFGFELISDTNGSDAALDGMSNSISDYDNDGDFDIYVANDTEPNVLLRNDEGQFTDVAVQAGLGVNALCWGSLWIDFDNDGFEDILVNTTSPSINNNQNNFYVNQQNGTFSQENSSLGLAGNDFNSYSNAKGDWNDDGFYDMIITNTQNATAALYTNLGEGKKWIKYSLEGTTSNRDAVGTLIETYVNGSRFIRYTMSGENYMSQDSQYEIVGVGNYLAVDSVVLTWPSGFVEKYFNLTTQNTYHFVEGSSLEAAISFPGPTNICGTDTITLDAGEWTSYFWNTGSEEQTIEVSEPGEYSVYVANNFGIGVVISATVEAFPQPELSVSVVQPSCYGVDDGSIEISVLGDTPQSIMWNGEIEGVGVANIGQGNYLCEIITNNGCWLDENFTLVYPEDITVEYSTSDVLCFGGNTGAVQFAITGGTGTTEPQWGNINPQVLTAGDYEILVLDDNNCEEWVEFSISQPSELLAQWELIEIPCFQSTGQIALDASGGLAPYIWDLDNVDIENIIAGDYSFTLTDVNNCSTALDFSIEENPEITAVFNSSNANNGNNGSALIVVSGGQSPYEYDWSNGSQSSVASSLGQGTYTCTITDDHGCQETFEVNIIDVNVNELMLDDNTKLYPVPFIDQLTIEVKEPENIEIWTIDGRLIFSERITGKRIIETTFWSQGVYVLNGNQRIVKL